MPDWATELAGCITPALQFDPRRGHGGYPFAPADRAKLLIGSRLDVDLRFDSFRAAAICFPHSCDMRADFWRFRDHRGVNVYRPRVFLAEQRQDPLQNLHAADSAERLVRVREMLSDVAGPDRAQQRIGNGVGQNVGIGMSFQSASMRNFHSAQDQLCALRSADGCRSQFRNGSMLTT